MGKLNKIQVKHLNRVSEAETGGYIRDYLFYNLRKTFWEVIHTKLDNPINDYMVLMQAARKDEGEHEQEKHNICFSSKCGVVSEYQP